MIGHVIRFWPEYVYLKKIYDEKTYGKLKLAVFSRICSRPEWSWEDWMMVPGKSGRAPLDLHIHDADFIMYLLGKPKAVRSIGVEEGTVISYITTQYIYDDVIVDAEGGWFDSCIPFSMSFRAVFEKAVLEYRDNKLMIYPFKDEPWTFNPKEHGIVNAGINIASIDGYYEEIQYFISCVKNNSNIEIVTNQGILECLDMVLKEVESVKTGEIIKL